MFNHKGDEEEDTSSDRLEGQLKCHLNGLYNGLTKIMTSTCNIENSEIKQRKEPFPIEKAIHNIMFIKHHMKRQDEFDAVRYDLIIQVDFEIIQKS